MPDIAQSLKDILNAGGKGFLSLSAVKNAMGATLKKQLGIAKSTTGQNLKKILEPHLGSELEIHKKGSVLYLVTNGAPADFVLKCLSPSSAKGPSALGKSLPFLSKAELAALLNRLIGEGRISVSLTDKYEARLTIGTKAAGETAKDREEKITEQPAPSGVLPSSGDRAGAFHAAFEALDQGKIFVRICDLRRYLRWTREDFDATLRTLRDEEVIQLHSGDATTMTPDEVRDGFVDENGFRMGTVTWNGK